MIKVVLGAGVFPSSVAADASSGATAIGAVVPSGSDGSHLPNGQSGGEVSETAKLQQERIESFCRDAFTPVAMEVETGDADLASVRSIPASERCQPDEHDWQLFWYEPSYGSFRCNSAAVASVLGLFISTARAAACPSVLVAIVFHLASRGH